LAWIWVIVPVIFFSFSESKLPGYILPIFPALAIILGVEIERFWNGARDRTLRAGAWLTALTLAGIGIGFIVFVRSELSSVGGWQVPLAVLPLAVALFSGIALALGRNRAFIAGAAGVVMSVIIAAVIVLFPTLQSEVSLKSLSLEAAAALRPGEKIAFYLRKEFAPVFYAEGRVLCEPRRGGTFYALHQNMLADALESESSLIVITDSKWLEGLETDPRFITEFIGAQGEAVALRVVMRK
jgi:4-amino-4-deoxy-L-arabinose transferase-like glycosyltransferase